MLSKTLKRIGGWDVRWGWGGHGGRNGHYLMKSLFFPISDFETGPRGPDQPVAPSLTAGAGQQCRHLSSSCPLAGHDHPFPSKIELVRAWGGMGLKMPQRRGSPGTVSKHRTGTGHVAEMLHVRRTNKNTAVKAVGRIESNH